MLTQPDDRFVGYGTIPCAVRWHLCDDSPLLYGLLLEAIPNEDVS